VETAGLPLLVVLSYLLGSIPSGVVLAGLMGGPDPRGVGSGNIGATNVLRALGPGAAILTLLADILKGAAPALAARLLLPGSPAPLLAGGAAILGHNFPVFLGFRGGKGVATSLGAFAGVDLLLTLVLAGVWVGVAGATRIASAASLAAAGAAPLAAVLLGRPAPAVAFFGGAAVLIWIRHRSNLGRLIAGTESRISLGRGDRGAGGKARDGGPPRS